MTLDEQLKQLHMNVIAGGGEDAILWLAVETHSGMVYNRCRNLSKSDDEQVFFCFAKERDRNTPKTAYMTVTYPTWQEAARDYVAWATFGVRKSGK